MRLRKLGATITKIEPPDGDPLKIIAKKWYQDLVRGQKVLKLDLKQKLGQRQLYSLLSRTDLLITSSRPDSLQRLGISWSKLKKTFPKLCYVPIYGESAPRSSRAGHDLTYQAQHGLVDPYQMPKILIADLAGASEVVSAALDVLLHRERFNISATRAVALSDAAKSFALPIRHKLTHPSAHLGGGSLRYGIYRCRKGWIALAALENKFWNHLLQELQLSAISNVKQSTLERAFLKRTDLEWEKWAIKRDIPLAALRSH